MVIRIACISACLKEGLFRTNGVIFALFGRAQSCSCRGSLAWVSQRTMMGRSWDKLQSSASVPHIDSNPTRSKLRHCQVPFKVLMVLFRPMMFWEAAE